MSDENDPETNWQAWHNEQPERDGGPEREAPESPNLVLGRRIAARRKELGKTQLELARRLGTTRSQITAWETGRNTITAWDVHRIASSLGTNMANLLDGIPSPPTLLTRIASLPVADQELIVRMVEALERRK